MTKQTYGLLLFRIVCTAHSQGYIFIPAESLVSDKFETGKDYIGSFKKPVNRSINLNLSSNRQEALARCHIHGFKVKQIADILNISESDALEQMNIYLHAKYSHKSRVAQR